MPVSLSRLLGFTGSSLGAVAFALPLTSAFAQEVREIVIQRIVLEEKGEKGEREEQEDDDDDDDENQPAYWIGVALDALEGSESADSLKISAVLPDSPALKAGLKTGDILLTINGNALKNLEQLVDSVQDSKGKTLKVKFSREGKEQVTEVHPAKRPGANAIVEREEKEEKGKDENGEKKEGIRFTPKPGQPGAAWRLEGTPQAGGGGLQFHLVPSPSGAHPGGQPELGGSAFPPGVPWGAPGGARGMPRMTMAAPQAQLPDDMEVSISKKGNKPAVVTARQGDKSWKTTENELGMLPPPAQAYASRLLGKDVMRGRTQTGGNLGMMPGMPGAPTMLIGGASIAPASEMRHIELRLNKDGKVEGAKGLEGGKNAPHVKVLPGGGIQVEIREGKEVKEEKKPEGKGAKEDPDQARRLHQLEEQRERLQDLLNKLREEAKQREKGNEKE